MKKMMRIGMTVFATLGFGFALGCDSGGGGAVPIAAASSQSPSPASPAFDLVVDALLGDDRASGTADRPLQTISEALARAQFGDRILVLAGTYDAQHGEAFPLTISPGVELIGDPLGRGNSNNGTIISGSGPTDKSDENNGTPVAAAVLVEADAKLEGFMVSNPESLGPRLPTAVALIGERTIIHSNTIHDTQAIGIGSTSRTFDHSIQNNQIKDSGVGISINDENQTMTVIEDNNVTKNLVGIDLNGVGSGVLVSNNIVRLNIDGIRVREPTRVDLGGGVRQGPGNNVISCNFNVDLWVVDAVDVAARNNFWDRVPPTTASIPTIGVDIVDSVGSADASGARIANSPCI